MLSATPSPAHFPDSSSEAMSLPPRSLDRQVLGNMGAGLIIALIAFYFPLLSITFHGMVTLVHEMGHAICACILGHPAIPAFDLEFGGGVTPFFERSYALLLLIYSILAWLIYTFRKNKLTLGLLCAIVLFHALLVVTNWELLAIAAMGHGFELVIATVFLYRGLTGMAVINPLERPLYAAIGLFIVIWDIYFACQLLTNIDERADYLAGKGGIHTNDFAVLSLSMGISLNSVVIIFLLCCLFPLILSFLAFRYQAHMWWLFERVMLLEE